MRFPETKFTLRQRWTAAAVATVALVVAVLFAFGGILTVQGQSVERIAVDWCSHPGASRTYTGALLDGSGNDRHEVWVYATILGAEGPVNEAAVRTDRSWRLNSLWSTLITDENDRPIVKSGSSYGVRDEHDQFVPIDLDSDGFLPCKLNARFAIKDPGAGGSVRTASAQFGRCVPTNDPLAEISIRVWLNRNIKAEHANTPCSTIVDDEQELTNPPPPTTTIGGGVGEGSTSSDTTDVDDEVEDGQQDSHEEDQDDDQDDDRNKGDEDDQSTSQDGDQGDEQDDGDKDDKSASQDGDQEDEQQVNGENGVKTTDGDDTSSETADTDSTDGQKATDDESSQSDEATDSKDQESDDTLEADDDVVQSEATEQEATTTDQASSQAETASEQESDDVQDLVRPDAPKTGTGGTLSEQAGSQWEVVLGASLGLSVLAATVLLKGVQRRRRAVAESGSGADPPR